MAKEDMIKFRKLLFSDSGFQEELRAAAEAYTGEQDVKSIFDNLLVPIAEKHGLSGTYEEFGEFLGSITEESESELSEDELAQIAGGKGGGLGIGRCVAYGVGVGAAGALTDNRYFGLGACLVVGAGTGIYSCAGSGEAESMFHD